MYGSFSFVLFYYYYFLVASSFLSFFVLSVFFFCFSGNYSKNHMKTIDAKREPMYFAFYGTRMVEKLKLNFAHCRNPNMILR